LEREKVYYAEGIFNKIGLPNGAIAGGEPIAAFPEWYAAA
jgi:hypothetical protein